GLEFFRGEARPGYVYHVSTAAEDAGVAVGGLHRAVAAQERPVVPVFATRVLIVLGEVGLDVAVAISPDRLHDARPRVADAHVARLAGPLGDFRPGFVVDHRMNPRRGGAAASGLHRMNRG